MKTTQLLKAMIATGMVLCAASTGHAYSRTVQDLKYDCSVTDSTGAKETFVLAQILTRASDRSTNYRMGLFDSHSLVCNVGPGPNPTPLLEGWSRMLKKTFKGIEVRDTQSGNNQDSVYIGADSRRMYSGVLLEGSTIVPSDSAMPELQEKNYVQPLALLRNVDSRGASASAPLAGQQQIQISNLANGSFKIQMRVENRQTDALTPKHLIGGFSGTCVIQTKRDDSCN